MPNKIIAIRPTDELSVPVTIAGVEYDVLVQPPEDSPLVTGARATLLEDMDIPTLVKHLSRVDELLLLTRTAIAGRDSENKGLEGRALMLHQDFGPACDAASATLAGFGNSANEVQAQMQDALARLYDEDGDVDIALDELAACSDVAKKMVKSAEELTENFSGLRDRAANLNADTTNSRNTHQQEKLALENRRKEFEERSARAQVLRDELAKQIPLLQTQMEDERKAEDKAEEREFTQSLVSSIFSAVGQGVGTFAAVATGAGETGMAARTLRAGAAASKGKGKAEKRSPTPADTEDTDDTTEDTLDDLDLSNLKGADRVHKRDILGGDDDLGDLDELLAQSPAHQKRTARHRTQDEPAWPAGMPAAQALAQAPAGEKPPPSGENASARHAALRRELLQNVLALQEQERQSLADIRAFALAISHANDEANHEQAAVVALDLAVKSLSEVVTTLQEVRRFWEHIVAGCQKLTPQGVLRSALDRLGGKTAAARLKELTREATCVELVTLSARWVAMRLVADEYREATKAIRAQNEASVRRAPSLAEAPALAEGLAIKLLGAVALDEQELKSRQDATNAALLDLPAAA